jgi:predicted dehydrogenase
MLRYSNGARGMLWASQVAVGCENGLQLRVYGDRGSLEWAQESPNEMAFTQFGAPRQRITRGGAAPPGGWAEGLGTRIPGGHPEGYLEAFATLYRDFATVVRGEETAPGALPSLADGLAGMRFTAAAIRSSRQGGAWAALNL